MKKKKEKKKYIDTVYRVDLEEPQVSVKSGRVWKYIYKLSLQGDEKTTEKQVQLLKSIGMGGRLVELDGSPDGKIVETWASQARLEIAMAEVKNETV